MVLTVDIGNSNIVIGVWHNASLQYTGRLQTRRDYTEDELTRLIEEMLFSDSNLDCVDYEDTAYSENELGIKIPGRDKCVCDFEGAILSSVVPEITDVTLHTLENITGKRPLLMGPFLHTGVDISDYAPGAIGTDRIVDLSAALAMYGAPVMVCDLGTCTTITVAGKTATASDVTGNDTDDSADNTDDGAEYRNIGKLIGGMICPGVQLSLDAEAQRASQLPQLSAGKVDSLLGKDTASNMMSGAVAATGLMLSELADRLVSGEEVLSDLKVVITGGLAENVMPWIKCSASVHYEQDLLLRGLYEVYCRNSCI